MRVFVPNNYRNSFNNKNKQSNSTNSNQNQEESNLNDNSKCNSEDNCQLSESQTGNQSESIHQQQGLDSSTSDSSKPNLSFETTGYNLLSLSSTDATAITGITTTTDSNQDQYPAPNNSASAKVPASNSSLSPSLPNKNSPARLKPITQQSLVITKETTSSDPGTTATTVYSDQKRRASPVLLIDPSCSHPDSRTKRQKSVSHTIVSSARNPNQFVENLNRTEVDTNTNTITSSSSSYSTTYPTDMGLPPMLQRNAKKASKHHTVSSSTSSNFNSSISIIANTNNNTDTGGLMDADSEFTTFTHKLKQKGLEEVQQEGDGNCLFRAVSLQVYGDSEEHFDVRKRCMDFMVSQHIGSLIYITYNAMRVHSNSDSFILDSSPNSHLYDLATAKEKEQEHFAQFVTDEPFQSYVLRKRQDGVHGNNPEIQAISELFNRPVEVFIPSNGAIPLNTFQSEYKTGDAPIRLAYWDGNHYNAVVDPLLPTAGLGLGLPGLQPGLADKLQMEKAVQESDEFFMKQISKESHDLEDNLQMERAVKESDEFFMKQIAMADSRKHSSYSSRDSDLMLEKKKAFSDLEETDFELEQAALIRSLETYQRSEGSRKMSSAVGRGRGRGTRGRTGVAVGAVAGPNANVNMNLNGYSHGVGMDRVNGANSSTSRSHSSTSRSHSYSSSSPAVASLSVAAASSSAAPSDHRDEDIPSHLLRHDYNGSGLGGGGGEEDEYPQVVQELVMNGFELAKVLKAYDLIGDNFDHLLAFLMSTHT
eukprot:scaffold11980_cov287-Chaetoceros_neogracile.AAC.4